MSKPREYSITFGGPGMRQLEATGRYVRVLDTPSADVFVSLDGAGELQMGAGQQVHDADGFRRLEVRSAVAQTVRLVTSDTPVDDNRTAVALTVNATVAGSTALIAPTVVTIPAGTTQPLVGANADRVELRVSVGSAEPSPVWLGPAGVNAGEGGLLEPGTIDYLATTAAVYAHNPHPTDPVDVSVLELESP